MKLTYLLNTIRPETTNDELGALKKKVEKIVIDSEQTYQDAVQMYVNHRKETE